MLPDAPMNKAYPVCGVPSCTLTHMLQPVHAQLNCSLDTNSVAIQ